MSASMTKKVSEYHDRLAQVMSPLTGQELTQGEVRGAYAAAFPERGGDLQWVMAADHSIDHTNDGPCECSRTDGAIFERLGRNRYRVRPLTQ
jgi:hypothetical protein